MPHTAPKNSPRRSKKNIDPSIPGEPSYRLHKRSGQAVTTPNRKDIYLGRHGTPESHQRYPKLDSAPCKGVDLQWVRLPPGNWSLQPVAIGAIEEVTNRLKPSV